MKDAILLNPDLIVLAFIGFVAYVFKTLVFLHQKKTVDSPLNKVDELFDKFSDFLTEYMGSVKQPSFVGNVDLEEKYFVPSKSQIDERFELMQDAKFQEQNLNDFLANFGRWLYRVVIGDDGSFLLHIIDANNLVTAVVMNDNKVGVQLNLSPFQMEVTKDVELTEMQEALILKQAQGFERLLSKVDLHIKEQ